MHVIFADEEKLWIDTKKFGWPLKDGCPEGIKKKIEKKKKPIDSQQKEFEKLWASK